MSEKPNILIVDDELGPRESLRMILKPHYNTFTATDGRSALEIVYSQPIDVITLDLKMPGTGGTDLLKAIKQYDSQIEIIIVTGYGTLKSAIEAIRNGVVDYILKPFNVFEILLAITKGLERRRMGDYVRQKLSKHPDAEEYDNFLASVIKEANQHIHPMSENGFTNGENYLDFLKVLALTLENKDEYTHGHSGRVAYYSNLIADRLKIDDESKKRLQIAAFLHDIGKLGLSNTLVDKEDVLTDQEWTIMREHPEKGVSLIENLGVHRDILDIIRHHHEKYNGKGYPYNLKGKDIPLGARIVALADAYDAMSSCRPYRGALSREEIRDEFRKCAGSHFCPEIVTVFLEVLEEEDFIKYVGVPGVHGAEAPAGGGKGR